MFLAEGLLWLLPEFWKLLMTVVTFVWIPCPAGVPKIVNDCCNFLSELHVMPESCFTMTNGKLFCDNLQKVHVVGLLWLSGCRKFFWKKDYCDFCLNSCHARFPKIVNDCCSFCLKYVSQSWKLFRKHATCAPYGMLLRKVATTCRKFISSWLLWLFVCCNYACWKFTIESCFKNCSATAYRKFPTASCFENC